MDKILRNEYFIQLKNVKFATECLIHLPGLPEKLSHKMQNSKELATCSTVFPKTTSDMRIALHLKYSIVVSSGKLCKLKQISYLFFVELL